MILIKESLNSDSQQLHKYQQNKQQNNNNRLSSQIIEHKQDHNMMLEI